MIYYIFFFGSGVEVEEFENYCIVIWGAWFKSRKDQRNDIIIPSETPQLIP